MAILADEKVDFVTYDVNGERGCGWIKGMTCLNSHLYLDLKFGVQVKG